jgi:hypothetical protein
MLRFGRVAVFGEGSRGAPTGRGPAASLPATGSKTMGELGIILTASLSLYALAATVFIILENRRPQATLAWMLAFFFAPGIGLLVYIFFG